MAIKRIIIFCLLLICVAYVDAMDQRSYELVSLTLKKEILWEKYIEDRKNFFEAMPDINHKERERLAEQKIVFNRELYKEMAKNTEVMAQEMGIDPTLCYLGVTPKLIHVFEYNSYKASIK